MKTNEFNLPHYAACQVLPQASCNDRGMSSTLLDRLLSDGLRAHALLWHFLIQFVKHADLRSVPRHAEGALNKTDKVQRQKKTLPDGHQPALPPTALYASRSPCTISQFQQHDQDHAASPKFEIALC